MFRRLLIANRGAIAGRIVRACQSLGVTSVVVYCPADRQAPFVSAAAEAHPLPEPPPNPYLDATQLIATARRLRCDAVHPGYGFLAEDPEFAAAVSAAGLTFIGPTAAQIRLLGDKVAARERLRQAGLPVFAGSAPLASLADAQRAAEQMGLPLLLKPIAGGGGIGMQRVYDLDALPEAFRRAQRLASAAFGDDRVFLERLVEDARHIELQLLASLDGAVLHAFERDCSVQRRQQKLIEEAPAPLLARSELSTLTARAVAAFEEIGYSNLGTLELLRDSQGNYGVLEVNTRIQVEHGVTEAITGLDLVALQLRLAAGEPLPAPPTINGHAIEVRITAENPATDQPSTGCLTRLDWPQLSGIRVEAGYSVGQWVTPHFDPLLGKLISHAPNRDRAIGQLRVALRAFRAEGVATNARQLEAILGSDDFAAGRWHTGRLQPGSLTALL